MNKKWLISLVVIVIAVIVGVIKVKTRDASTSGGLKIGAVLPMTGSLASHGEEMKKGIEFATEEFPSAVKVVIEDDMSSSEGTATAVTKLISMDKVPIILGPASSSAALAAAPICQRNGVVLYTPSGSSPKITESGDFIFSSGPMSEDQVEAMAEYAFVRLGVKRVAVLYMQNETGVSYNDGFVAAFGRRGGEIVLSESYQRETTDFRAILSKIDSRKVDAIYCPAIPQSMGLIAKQVKELGISAILLANYGIEDGELFSIAGDAAEGIYFTATPISETFQNRFRQRFGENPGIGAALAYDSASIVLGLVKAGKTTSVALRDGLRQTANYEGACGALTFNAKGEGHRAIAIKVVRANSFQFIE